MSTVGKTKAFKCNECHKAYEFKSGLYKHKNIAHKGKRFTCMNCGKLFKSKDRVVYHQMLSKQPCLNHQTKQTMQSRSTTDTGTQTNSPQTALSYNTEPPGPAETVVEEQAQAAISPTTGDA